MFTRQHYKKFADMILSAESIEYAKLRCCNGPLLCQNKLVENLILLFKQDNPLFSESKFREYLENPK
jgi:hypothetical protein